MVSYARGTPVPQVTLRSHTREYGDAAVSLITEAGGVEANGAKGGASNGAKSNGGGKGGGELVVAGQEGAAASPGGASSRFGNMLKVFSMKGGGKRNSPPGAVGKDDDGDIVANV